MLACVVWPLLHPEGARASCEPWPPASELWRRTVLLTPDAPVTGALSSGCVGLVARPAYAAEVTLRVLGSDGAEWGRDAARPWAFVRGCGDDGRFVLSGPRSVAVELVALRDPPAGLAVECVPSRPGLEARPLAVGPSPSAEEVLPEPSATVEAELSVELPSDGGRRRVDLGRREGCLRIDVAGAVTGGELHVGSAVMGLWAAPSGAWAVGCAEGQGALFLEGSGLVQVRVARWPSRVIAIGGEEARGMLEISLGAASPRLPQQAFVRAGETLRLPVEGAGECVRVVAVAADESIDARFELRLLGPEGTLRARDRGGPGRPARVDACGALEGLELVGLGPAGRIVVVEGSW